FLYLVSVNPSEYPFDGPPSVTTMVISQKDETLS
ncbi:hypothetical protein FOMG_19422, partial [Fusarium oxysporum f. sp. melonis 26406]